MTTATRGVNAWAVADALRHRPSALFADLDGTLCSVAATPDAASLAAGCREALRSIASRIDLLCILSGRGAEDARAIVGIEDALYVGDHGAERSYRGEVRRAAGSERYAAYLARARDVVRAELAGIPGAVLETKGIAFAVHFRQAPAARGDVLRLASRVALLRGLEVVERTGHVEVRIPGVEDKGSAVRELATDLGLRGVVVLGDDATDLPAFDRAREHGEATDGRCVVVSVGEELREDADIWLASPADAAALLRAVASDLDQAPSPASR